MSTLLATLIALASLTVAIVALLMQRNVSAITRRQRHDELLPALQIEYLQQNAEVERKTGTVTSGLVRGYGRMNYLFRWRRLPLSVYGVGWSGPELLISHGDQVSLGELYRGVKGDAFPPNPPVEAIEFAFTPTGGSKWARCPCGDRCERHWSMISLTPARTDFPFPITWVGSEGSVTYPGSLNVLHDPCESERRRWLLWRRKCRCFAASPGTP